MIWHHNDKFSGGVGWERSGSPRRPLE